MAPQENSALRFASHPFNAATN